MAAYQADDKKLAKKVSDALRKDLEQQISYYNSLNTAQQEALGYDMQSAQQLLQQINSVEQVHQSLEGIGSDTDHCCS